MLPEQFTIGEAFEPVDVETWRAVVEKDLRGVPFEKKLISHTYEGIDVQPLYTSRDWASAQDVCGFPGERPMVRGGAAGGHVTGGWDVREERGESDLEKLHHAVLGDLESGATSVEIVLDRAAHAGQDPAGGMIGGDGAAIFCLNDLDAVFDDVFLEMIGVGFRGGSACLAHAANLVALWKRRGVDLTEARGAFNMDPLGVIARLGVLAIPMDRAEAQMALLARWTSEHLPNTTAVRINTSPYHDAGATAAQDLGCAMASGAAYLRAMTSGGMGVNEAARQIVFEFSVSCNLFLAASKLRAARRLWAQIIAASGGDQRAQRMSLHVRTGRRSLTQRDPWVNLLRNTVCCFAGAIGGADSIASVAFDSPLGEADELSWRLARNTQLILEEETHLHRVIDPVGGSWYVEWLTDQVAQKGWALFREIERQGGMSDALVSGWIRKQIDSAFAPRQANIAKRKDAITGVSEYPDVREQSIEKEPIDVEALMQSVRERLAGRTVARDLKESVERVRRTADSGGVTLIDDLVHAAEAGASVHEMCAAMWSSAGEGVQIAPLAPHPFAQPFETLRDACDEYAARSGRRPRVFLAGMGPISSHTARVHYARSFFEAGGFEVVNTSEGYEDAASAGRAFQQSGASIVVVCSSDALYESLVPEVVPALREWGAKTIVLAGHPGAHEAAYKNAGVDRFIYIKCDVLKTLRELLQEEGVLS